jgi:hypothetical protein
MIRVFRALKNIRPNFKLGKGQNLPNLPYEIWIIIFEMVIYSNIMVQMEFEPLQIEAGFACLTNRSLCSKQAAQETALDVRKALRMVCVSWKQMIDSVELNDRWVVEHGCIESNDPTPANTRNCSRLNISYPIFPKSSQLPFRWTHPIPTVSLRISARGPSNLRFATSLLNLLSFPGHIRALDLEFGILEVPKEVLKDLQVVSVQLITLCLTLWKVNILQISLTIPTLVSLFLSIPMYDDHPPSCQWVFPALRNLSLYENQHYDPQFILRSTNSFFVDLLKNNLQYIESLLIFPMTQQIFRQDSSLCWIRMPRLQVLATNFGWIDIISSFKELTIKREPSILKSTSIRHLIQLQMYAVEPHQVVSGLKRYLLACNQLEDITLVNPSDELTMSLKRGSDSKAIKDLLKTRDDKRVQIWKQDRDSLCERTLLRSSRR